jgi:hypothetical protein
MDYLIEYWDGLFSAMDRLPRHGFAARHPAGDETSYCRSAKLRGFIDRGIRNSRFR